MKVGLSFDQEKPVDQARLSVDDTTKRVVDARARTRRSRLHRDLLPVIVMSVLLCTVVVWGRNRTRINQLSPRFDVWVQDLRGIYNERGELPLVLPKDMGGVTGSEFTYIDSQSARVLGSTDADAIIGYSRPIRQVFGPDLRLTAIKRGDTIDVSLLSVAEFNDRLKSQRDRVDLVSEAAWRDFR